MSRRGANFLKNFGGSGKHASSTKAYHNGGVEGKSFHSWYTQVLAPHFDEVLDDIGPKSICDNGTKGGSHGGTNGGTKGGTHGGSKGGSRGGSKGGTRGGSKGGSKGGTRGGSRGGSKGGTRGGHHGWHGGTRGSHGGTKGGSRGGSKGGTRGSNCGTKGSGGTKGGSGGTKGSGGGTKGGNGDNGGVPTNTAVTIGVVEYNDDQDDNYDDYVRIRADEVPDNATPQDYVDAITNWYAQDGKDLDDLEVRKLVFENDQGQVVASLYRTEDGGWSDTEPTEADPLMIPMTDAELAALEAEQTAGEDDDPSGV